MSGVRRLVEPSQTLKIKVHGVRVRGPFRAPSLGGDKLGAQRVRQTRDDLVLHVEEIGQGLVESLGPEMMAVFGVDELHVDAHAGSAALNAALEHIADVQIAADLLQVDGLALVSESGVAPDHERAANARKIGRQALRDAVDEMLLLHAASDIGERQDDHREARRALSVRRGGGGRGCDARRANFDRVRSHRPRDVLQRLLAEIDELGLDLAAHMLVGRARDQHAARLADRLRAAPRY